MRGEARGGSVTFLVGPRPYILSEANARSLVEMIRTALADADWEAETGLAIAWAIELELEESRGEEIELGWQQGRVVSDVLRAERSALRNEQLEALYRALRWRGDTSTS